MKDEDRQVGELAYREGWEIVSRFFNAEIERLSRRLTEAEFDNLQEVGRLQGEITGYRRVLGFVDKRREKLKEA